MIVNDNTEIHFVDYGAAKVYYTIQDSNTIYTQGRKITLSRDKFLDFLATAKVLGYNTGKL